MGRRPQITLPTVLLGLGLAPAALAASPADLETMNRMALLLGRAVGCDLETRRATHAIGAWLDQIFPPGSADRTRYLPAFAEDVRRHAREQQQGLTADSCDDVAQALNALNW